MSSLASLEAEALGTILLAWKNSTADFAERLRSNHVDPVERAHAEKTIELRFALIAIVEAAIAEGLRPDLALLSMRDAALTGWAIKMSAQYAGTLDLDQSLPTLTDIANVFLQAAGVPTEFEFAIVTELPESGFQAQRSTSPTRH